MIFIPDQRPDYTWENMQNVPSTNFMQLNYVIQLCAGGVPVKLFSQREKRELWKSEKNKIGIDTLDYDKITGGVKNSLILLGRNKRKFISHRIYFYPEANRIVGVLEPKNPKNDQLFGMEERDGYPFAVLSTDLLWRYYERQQGHEYQIGIWDHLIPGGQHV